MLRALVRLFSRRREREAPGPVKVIIGLGNPGQRYEHTRHNVGWWFVDHLADVWHLGPWRREGSARVSSGRAADAAVQLVKPQTFMNLSGGALGPYLARADWTPSDLLVVVDDVALPVGRYRFRARGSAGGHNGLKSIEAALGHQDYPRLRIGVGPASGQARGDLADFVLSEFEDAEARAIRELLPSLADGARLWVREGIVAVMNSFNRVEKC